MQLSLLVFLLQCQECPELGLWKHALQCRCTEKPKYSNSIVLSHCAINNCIIIGSMRAGLSNEHSVLMHIRPLHIGGPTTRQT